MRLGSLQKTVVIVIVALWATACRVSAQQSGVDAIRKLSFLTGTWACTVKGGSSNGFVQKIRYSLSPDGLWMSEVSLNSEPGGDDYATQMWGYDVRAGKLVAYNFTPTGVYTKTVDGWVDGNFTSRRDDNGATVSLKPIDNRTMQWIVSSADHSYVVTQDCARLDGR